MVEWQNVSDKTYGGTEDNKVVERMYNQPQVPKPNKGLLYCVYFSYIGIAVIFLAIIIAGLSRTISGIMGIVGCCMTLFGIFCCGIEMITSSFREKKGN